MKINIQPNEKETRVCLIGELDTTATTTQVNEGLWVKMQAAIGPHRLFYKG